MDLNEKKELVKILIDVHDSGLEVSVEGVWSVRVGENLYEVRNSPWYTTEINFKDIVKAIAQDDDSNPMFIEVYKRSGHRTIQVIFMQEEAKESILAELKRLGVTYEGANKSFYALDLKPGIDFDLVADYLEEQQQKGQLAACYAAQPQPAGIGELVN